MIQLIFATGNENKLRELREIFADFEILSLKDIDFTEDIEENGSSFAENALIKARAVHQKTGRTVIADDSGLCVEALGGEPGVYSARYAGKHGGDAANNLKLIEKLKSVEKKDRKAFFDCAAAVVFEDGTEGYRLGRVAGQIAFEPRGEGGFGYDPYFIVDGTDKTYSQMNDMEKNEISHRKLAFGALKPIVEEYYSKKDKL